MLQVFSTPVTYKQFCPCTSKWLQKSIFCLGEYKEFQKSQNNEGKPIQKKKSVHTRVVINTGND